MTITIGPELEEQARRKAQAEGLTIQTYIERLIQEDAGWEKNAEEPLRESDPELHEIRSAVMEGLNDAERGGSKSAQEVFAELRKKHGIPG